MQKVFLNYQTCLDPFSADACDLSATHMLKQMNQFLLTSAYKSHCSFYLTLHTELFCFLAFKSKTGFMFLTYNKKS